MIVQNVSGRCGQGDEYAKALSDEKANPEQAPVPCSAEAAARSLVAGGGGLVGVSGGGGRVLVLVHVAVAVTILLLAGSVVCGCSVVAVGLLAGVHLGEQVDEVHGEDPGVLARRLGLQERVEVVLLLAHRRQASLVARDVAEALHGKRLLGQRGALREGRDKELDELELAEERADRLVARELGEGEEGDGGRPRGAGPGLALERALEACLERLEGLLGRGLVEVDVAAAEVDDGRHGVEAGDLEQVVVAEERLLAVDNGDQRGVDDARVLEHLGAVGVRGERRDRGDGLGLDRRVLGPAEVGERVDAASVRCEGIGGLNRVGGAVAHGACRLELGGLVVLLHHGREVVEHAGRLHDLRGDRLGPEGVGADGLARLGLQLAVGPGEELGASLKHLGLPRELVLGRDEVLGGGAPDEVGDGLERLLVGDALVRKRAGGFAHDDHCVLACVCAWCVVGRWCSPPLAWGW
mmetsp:Transcript_10683/g.21156  ORF Transcript_10683/g.21156 Transcript_10683/m.21156 type:complete len:467 (+) Transcript_10683:204-1604(+)